MSLKLTLQAAAVAGAAVIAMMSLGQAQTEVPPSPVAPSAGEVVQPRSSTVIEERNLDRTSTIPEANAPSRVPGGGSGGPAGPNSLGSAPSNVDNR